MFLETEGSGGPRKKNRKKSRRDNCGNYKRNCEANEWIFSSSPRRSGLLAKRDVISSTATIAWMGKGEKRSRDKRLGGGRSTDGVLIW